MILSNHKMPHIFPVTNQQLLDVAKAIGLTIEKKWDDRFTGGWRYDIPALGYTFHEKNLESPSYRTLSIEYS